MPDVSRGELLWRKSTTSNSDCVEVAARDGYVLVRDSRDPTRAVLEVPQEAWGAFLRGVKLRDPHDV